MCVGGGEGGKGLPPIWSTTRGFAAGIGIRFMSPASKQFEEHIASGAFVRPGRRREGAGLRGRATSYLKNYTGICRWNRYTFYAHSFEEIVGAYCLWGVRPSVCSFVRSSHFFDAKHNFRAVHATVLKVFKWIHHEKKNSSRIFFSTGLRPFPELWSFDKNMAEILSAEQLKNY